MGLKVTGRYIIGTGISKYAGSSLIFIDRMASSADHNSKLSLVIHPIAHRRIDNILLRSDDSSRRLHEHNRSLRNLIAALLCMVAVIQSDAENLPRLHRGEQFNTF